MVFERDENNDSKNNNSKEDRESEDDENQNKEKCEAEDIKGTHLIDSSKKSVFECDLIEQFRERCNSLDSLIKEERKLTNQARRTVRRHSVQHVQWADTSGQTLQAEIPIPLREEENSDSEDTEPVPVEPIKVPTEMPRPILKRRRNSRVDPNQPTCVIVIHEDKEQAEDNED